MGKNKNISDELLAAYLEGNVTKEEMAQVLEAIGTDAEIQEILDIALRLEEEEEEQDPVLRVAAEGGRNLCDIQCEAFVLRRRGIDTNEEELFGVAKENHWIRRVGTPLQFMGNLLKYKGLKVKRKYESTIDDIKNALARGDSPIVAVDCDKLYPERPDEEDATNHAIVVTKVNAESVTIYDPENITEVDIQLKLFMSAWKESRCYLVCSQP